jgi:PAS domain S-box-containing protein
MNLDGSAVDLASLLVQGPDATIFADRDGVVRVWNAAAERIFGYPADAAIGQNLDIIIPEKLREAHWAGYDRALAAGDTKYRGQSLPTRAVKQDGSEIYVELSFAIVHGSDGGVAGAMAQARDITERFERDRAMRRRLRELEQASDTAGSTRAG